MKDHYVWSYKETQVNTDNSATVKFIEGVSDYYPSEYQDRKDFYCSRVCRGDTCTIFYTQDEIDQLVDDARQVITDDHDGSLFDLLEFDKDLIRSYRICLEVELYIMWGLEYNRDLILKSVGISHDQHKILTEQLTRAYNQYLEQSLGV